MLQLSEKFQLHQTTRLRQATDGIPVFAPEYPASSRFHLDSRVKLQAAWSGFIIQSDEHHNDNATKNDKDKSADQHRGKCAALGIPAA